MAHVRLQGLDFVVSAFIVHPTEPKTLLVNHKKLGNKWFGIGGHVGDDDPYEDLDQALLREIEEESGLQVLVVTPPTLLRKRPPLDPAKNHESVLLFTPWAVERHIFPGLPEKHLHLALVYFCVAGSRELRLETEAHNEIRWFSHNEIEIHKDDMLDSIRWYAHESIRVLHGVDCMAYWLGNPGRYQGG